MKLHLKYLMVILAITNNLGYCSLGCQSGSTNTAASMCKTKYPGYCLNSGDYRPSTDMACAIANFTPGSEATLDWTINTGPDASVTCQTGKVIQCFDFAAVGKVGGACTQITGTDEECHFKEDPSGIIEQVPDSILSQCINESTCTIKVDDVGFQLLDNSGNSLSTAAYTNASQFSGQTGLKLKLVPICGASNDFKTGSCLFDVEGTWDPTVNPDDNNDDDDKTDSSVLLQLSYLLGFLIVLIF